MKSALLTQLLIGLITFLTLLVVGKTEIIRHRGFIVIFFLFYFVDNLAIALTNQFPGLQFIPNHLWGGFLVCGWSGKVYSIVITLILLYIIRPLLSFSEAGISPRQNKGSLIPSAGIILSVALWSAFVGSQFPQGDFDLTTLVYLAVMPGLNEELVYRGILPACLDRLFPKNWVLASAKVGWGTVITTALFGLLHGVWLDNHFEFHFEVFWIRNALVSGFTFAWLRERTDSLIMPMIAHGAWDFFLFLPRMI